MQVAIYARKSTEREDRQIQSLEDQLNALRNLAKREGIVVAREFIEARSAKEPGTRPEFGELIRQIQEGAIEGVLTWQINRLSRNMLDGGLIAHLLHSGKLQFIRTPDRTYFPEDSALLLAIETGAATSFIQDLKRNVKRGMDSKASSGWRPSKAPLGYVNNPVTREIDVDPDRFKILQHGWEMLGSGGYSVADVAREVRKLGLTGTKRKQPIALSRIYSIFRNEFYAGQFRYEGQLVAGKHTPMISKEAFERVQVNLGRTTKHHDLGQKHPYAGVFKCPACGCSVTAETKIKVYKASGTERAYTYYRCTGARGCRGKAIRAEYLDQALERLASQICVSASTRKWAERCLAESLERSALHAVASKSELERTAERLQARLGRIRGLRIDNELSQEEFMSEKLLVTQQLEQTLGALEQVTSLAESIWNSVTEKLDLMERASSWSTMAGAAKRSLLRSLGSEAFLTLERMEFCVDAVLVKLLAIGPHKLSSESLDQGPRTVSVPIWYEFWDEILTLESDRVFLHAVPKQTFALELGIAKSF